MLKNKYKCVQCLAILERESNKQWVKSYCAYSGKTVHLKLQPEKTQLVFPALQEQANQRHQRR